MARLAYPMQDKRKLLEEYKDRIEKLIKEGMEKRKEALKSIKAAKKDIRSGKKSGIVTTKAETSLNIAESTLKSASKMRDFETALERAKDAEKKAKSIKSYHSSAKEFREKAFSKIKTSKLLGANISRAEEMFSKVDPSMDDGDYEVAFRYAKQAFNLATDAEFMIQQIGERGAGGEGGGPRKDLFLVEDVFLIYNDGILIAHETSKEGKDDMDTDIFGSMFTAIQDFVKDSFGKDDALGGLNFGENMIAIRRGHYSFLAASIFGSECEELTETMDRVMKKFEGTYAGVVEDWDGSQDTLSGSKEIIHEVLALTEGITKEQIKKLMTQKTVKVLSEVEFYQGFVRLKVAIRNDTDTVITDVKFDVEYDDNVLRLDHIEPEREVRRNKVQFGNINSMEKKTVGVYLDPLICMESPIDGSITYKDIYGTMKTTNMKQRKAEVVCPIFFTQENINTAMLKRLIEGELNIHDSKVWSIPPGINKDNCIKFAKEAIQSHDVKFVREFSESDEFEDYKEAWFYGKTKVKKNQLVIRTSARAKTNTIEIFIASTHKPSLTGLLAELGHTLQKKLEQAGVLHGPLMQITDRYMKESVVSSSTLLLEYTNKATLSILKRSGPNEYEIGVRVPTEEEDTKELFETVQVEPEKIEKFHKAMTSILSPDGSVKIQEMFPEESKEEIVRKASTPELKDIIIIGRYLFKTFIPEKASELLCCFTEPLILKTNDRAIPWQFLHDGTEFVSLKSPYGLRLRMQDIPRVNTYRRQPKNNILFIADSGRDMEIAKSEVEEIIGGLGEKVEVSILTEDQANKSRILAELKKGTYDIIHYIGYADLRSDDPDNVALLVNGEKVSGSDIKLNLKGKPLVFLNAFPSDSEPSEGEIKEGESHTLSPDGLVSSFMLGGALGCVGTSWPVADVSANPFSAAFYKNVIEGKSIGTALKEAKIDQRDARPDDIHWASFVLYGDPNLKLVEEKRK